MTSNSQFGEDLVVANFFESQEGRGYKGTLLDIGANDGKTLSNSRWFIQQGWKADLVEPSPLAYAALWKEYKDNPDVTLYQCAIGEDNPAVDFLESGTIFYTGDVALVSTLKEEETTMYRERGIMYRPIKVESLSFEKLRLISPLKKYDFITIDAEGMDLEILRQINLTELECRCLCVEYNGKNKEAYKEYCKSHGMFLHEKNHVNLIFIK